MDVLDDVTERNATFADNEFSPNLTMMPSMNTMIIGRVDPRVDPEKIFGLKQGEAAVIRNIDGRVTPDTFKSMGLLRPVVRANGAEIGPGWNLIVLHHTDCGIAHLTQNAEMLAGYLGVAPADLEALAIADPHTAVAVDVAKLKANPNLPGEFTVSGVVYNVANGKIETVVAPARLRP